MDADEVSRRLETKHLIDSLRNCEWDIEKWMQSHYQKFKELFENLREVSFYYIPKGGLVAKPVLKTVIVDWSYVCTYQLWLKKMDCEDDLKQAQEKAVGKASLCGLGRFFDRLKIVLEDGMYYFPRNELLQTEFMRRIRS